jgi:hypothetical protein
MGHSWRMRARLRLRFLLLLAALALGAQGCHYPAAVHTYECVTDYARMSGSYDPLLSLVYVPEATSFKDCRRITVGDVQVGQAWVDSPEEAAGYATFFRAVLRRELVKLGKFDFVSLDKDEGHLAGPPQAGSLLVEGKITKFDMGSGFWRYVSYFLWFLQSGATDFQVEGRITQADTGKLLVEFADRRRHLCNTPFGPNPHNFDKGYAMKVTVTETARCLARFIEMGCDQLPAVYAETPAGQVVTAAAQETP